VGDNNTKANFDSIANTNPTVIHPETETCPLTHSVTPKHTQNELEAAKDSDGSTSIPEIQGQDTLPIRVNPSPPLPLADPRCYGMSELPEASKQRARVSEILAKRATASSFLTSPAPSTSTSGLASPLPLSTSSSEDQPFERSALFAHLAHGLAYTTGSALGSTPPSLATCRAAYLVPNRAKLTAGARAWAKHSHRSAPPPGEEGATDRAMRTRSAGWWGTARGPVAAINEQALALFWKVMHGATWRNLHWLPHRVLVYEVRVPEGYGMRWSQDQSGCEDEQIREDEERPWMFRGFLEPTMENGHELKWRHPISPIP
jgi:hypothetical protein